MGSLAQLAIASGHRVTGSDANVYPPMSTQLIDAGIELIEGFDPAQLDLEPDVVVVGNVVSRGNPVMEAVLNRGLPYISGPQWLAENVLKHKWVLAVAGTHGKTTTSSMLAWILEYAGMRPGYLIGGVPGNFATSARLGETDFFVIEADEYDTAFFDKRSKFVHYHPRTLVINNLEFDHADIFPDLAAIQTQFHHVVRTVPSDGLVLCRKDDAIAEVIEQGCWSNMQTMSDQLSGADWNVEKSDDAGLSFEVLLGRQSVGRVRWTLTGDHNIQNALSAVAAARHIGVLPEVACDALSVFEGVKRRMEVLLNDAGVAVYDDFAHHPTAIASTLAGLRARVGDEHIVAIIDPRSNTMKQGVHRDSLLASVAMANTVFWYQNQDLSWSLEEAVGREHLSDAAHLSKSQVLDSVDKIIAATLVCAEVRPVHIVIMSNGGFEGIHQRLVSSIVGANQ